jgi:hypothetical protein
MTQGSARFSVTPARLSPITGCRQGLLLFIVPLTLLRHNPNRYLPFDWVPLPLLGTLAGASASEGADAAESCNAKLYKA